jgi:CheY-like chemotaxis protein
LKQYDARNSSDNLSSSTNASQTSPKSPTGGLDEFGSTLGLCPSPLAIRTQSSSDFEEIAAAPAVQAQSPPKAVHSDIDSPNNPHVQQALIVDDNSINRKLLSAWMKRHKIPFKEAKDGQQALDTYKEAGGKFDVILMDISMPVMDGMTSTRLIREHEKEKELTPSHIIALTGLTSASAKLEAWTCGVDDFMTKPVDFKKLESLMEAGRGGEGTGFLKEQGSIKTEKTTTVA